MRSFALLLFAILLPAAASAQVGSEIILHGATHSGVEGVLDDFGGAAQLTFGSSDSAMPVATLRYLHDHSRLGALVGLRRDLGAAFAQLQAGLEVTYLDAPTEAHKEWRGWSAIAKPKVGLKLPNTPFTLFGAYQLYLAGAFERTPGDGVVNRPRGELLVGVMLGAN